MKHAVSFIAFAAVVGAALMAVAPAAGAAPARVGRGPAAATNEELDAIKAVAATDIWVLGHNDTTSAPLVWHGNGRTWTQLPVPSRLVHGGILADIAATSPDSAWAVGATSAGDTLILHWNGTAWSRQASPDVARLGGELSAVTATSARDAWAAGDACGGAQVCHPLILHWNGTRWSKTASPMVADSDQLKDVTATAPGSAWTDGLTCSIKLGCPSGAIMLHWNGKAWSSQKLPATRGLGLFAVAATTARDPWAFGRVFSGGSSFTPLALRWTGSRWVTASPPARLVPNGALESGAMSSPHDIWAVGLSTELASTVLVHWNGTAWSRAASPTPGAGGTTLNGVAAVARDDAWAAGFYCPGAACKISRPLLQHWNGKTWATVSI